MAFLYTSYENVLIWVFLHAEFISALKTVPISIVFEKHGKKLYIFIIIILYFFFDLYIFISIFSKSLKQKCLIPTESCFLDGKKTNIAKLVDIKFWPITRKIARL